MISAILFYFITFYFMKNLSTKIRKVECTLECLDFLERLLHSMLLKNWSVLQGTPAILDPLRQSVLWSVVANCLPQIQLL